MCWICRQLDAARVLLRVLRPVNLLWVSSDTSNHTPDSVLECTVLRGVDKRVNAAVRKHQHQARLVEPVELQTLGLQLLDFKTAILDTQVVWLLFYRNLNEKTVR